MRVTKTIREYIEKQVKAIMPKTSPEEEIYQFEYQKIQDFRNSASEKLKAYASELIAEFYEENGFTPTESWSLKPNSWMGINESGSLPSCAKSYVAKSQREKATRDAIENIIVTLELGGNKADLDKILSDLKGE